MDLFWFVWILKIRFGANFRRQDIFSHTGCWYLWCVEDPRWRSFLFSLHSSCSASDRSMNALIHLWRTYHQFWTYRSVFIVLRWGWCLNVDRDSFCGSSSIFPLRTDAFHCGTMYSNLLNVCLPHNIFVCPNVHTQCVKSCVCLRMRRTVPCGVQHICSTYRAVHTNE